MGQDMSSTDDHRTTRWACDEFLAPTTRQAVMANVEEGALAARCQVSTLTRDTGLGFVEPACRKAVATGLVHTWHRAGSLGQMLGGLEPSHVEAYLGQDRLCRLFVDSRRKRTVVASTVTRSGVQWAGRLLKRTGVLHQELCNVGQ